MSSPNPSNNQMTVYLQHDDPVVATPTQEITNDDPENVTLIKYSYFSTKYIPPNTYNRELAYYYSAFVHIIALHVLPPVTCMCCIIYSDKHKYPVLH